MTTPNASDIPGPDTLASLDATELLTRLSRGTTTSVALCEHLLERVHRHAGLNAFSWLDDKAVLDQAHAADHRRAQGQPVGALAGLPIAVKDNIGTAGYPTSAGTATLKRFFPGSHAPVWERLAREGAVLFGKTNMHELACGGSSTNPVFGHVRNPRAPDRIPGGSSGGSAAAVAAHLVPVALGTDTSGSVRMPSAMCGIAGLRPSTGHYPAYSNAGVVPLVRFIDTIGPMARSARDLALLHAVATGRGALPVPPAGALRMGIPAQPFWDDLQPDVKDACSQALEKLSAAGVVLVPVDIEKLAQRAVTFQKNLGACSRLNDLKTFLLAERTGVSLAELLAGIASADVREIYALPIPADLHADELLREFDGLLAAYLDVLDRSALDALAYPTSPVTAPLIRETGDRFSDAITHNGREVNTSATTARHSRFAAGLGVPAVSLPCAASALPVGLELCGRPGGDDALLAAARCVSHLLGTTAGSGNGQSAH